MEPKTINSNIKNPISDDYYVKAFMKHFNCNGDEIVLASRQQPFHGEKKVYIKHQGIIYQVLNDIDLRIQCEKMVNDPDYILPIPIEIWSIVARNAHSSPEFISNLLESEKIDTQALRDINMAITLSCFYQSPSIFWQVIEALDDRTLYPKCIVACVSSMKTEDVIGRLMHLFVMDGQSFLNELNKNGMFATVRIPLNDDIESKGVTNALTFHIFTKDPAAWDEFQHSFKSAITL